MARRTEATPGPAQPALPGIEVVPPHFNPDQRRAFGSVPGLLDPSLEIPSFEQLNELALQRVQPDVLRQGLFGVHGRNAVNGVALNPAQYTAIIRHQPSFMASVRSKTLLANTLNNDLRAREKEFQSVLGALRGKDSRHTTVLRGLAGEADNLRTLSAWQKSPGYSRTSEADMRERATQAWQGSFMNMLSVLQVQHDLDADERIAMEHALAYNLFRGPQADRMAAWGGTLGVAQQYNHAVLALFAQSARHITEARTELEVRLAGFYTANGLQPQ